MDNDNHRTGSAGAGYEKRDADIRKVFLLIIVGVILLALILYVLNVYFIYQSDEAVYQAVLKPESKELIQLRDREDAILSSYGVVDSADGVYRIPIDSAMQKMLVKTGADEGGEK